MLIRPMTIEDVKQVAEIEAQCFSLPWSEQSFMDSLQRTDTIFLVCEQVLSAETEKKKSNHVQTNDEILALNNDSEIDLKFTETDEDDERRINNPSFEMFGILRGGYACLIQEEEGENFQNKEYFQEIQKDVTLSDRKIIGYIGMYISFDEGEIVNVAVAPFARKNGIGDVLIKSIKKLAKERKIQKIVLEVRKSNQPAIHLYEKNEFVFVGIRKNFYERPIEDANIMICEL